MVTTSIHGGKGSKNAGVDSTGGPILSADRNMALLQLARTKYATLVSSPGMETATVASCGSGLPSSTSMPPATPGVKGGYRMVASMLLEAVPDGNVTRGETPNDAFTA
jgi:hypothetical protein